MEAQERSMERPLVDQPLSPAAPEEAEIAARESLFEAFWHQLDEEEAEEKFAPEVAELHARQVEFDNYWLQLDLERASSKSSASKAPQMAESEVAELDVRQRDLEQFWMQRDSEVESPVSPKGESSKRAFKRSQEARKPAKISLSTEEGTQSELAAALLVGSPSRSIRRLAKDSRAGYASGAPKQASSGGYTSGAEVPKLPLGVLDTYGSEKLTDQYNLSSLPRNFAGGLDLQERTKPARLAPLQPKRSTSSAALHELSPKSNDFGSKAFVFHFDAKPESSTDGWSVGRAGTMETSGLTRCWSSTIY